MSYKTQNSSTLFAQKLVWAACLFVGSLPIKWQNKISDLLFVLLYKVLKYRVKVTRDNLRNSFPEKNDAQRLQIEENFYRNLADIFVESITLPSLSEEDIRNRFVYVNEHVLADAIEQGGIALCAMAHQASWEYTIGYKLYTDAQVLAVYHPLTSKVMDSFYRKMRSKFGARPIAMADVAKEILMARRSGTKTAVALIADQTPPKPQIKEWFDFLNQPTAFFAGTEKLALKYGLPIVFMDVTRVRRGYYSAYYYLLYDGKEKVQPGEITARYASRLEIMIQREPHLWLWSHKRWKHMPPKN